MKLTDQSITNPALETYLTLSGFRTPTGELDATGALGAFTGRIQLDDNYIIRSGGLLQAVSRKSAEILRQELQGLAPRAIPDDLRRQWHSILLHAHPHLDEYFASLFLRACLPDDMHTLETGETALFSRTDDAQAQARWPHAAVLGVGNTVNGGATPLLLFDEHEAHGDDKRISSLAMLMKRYMLADQQLPSPLFTLLRETDHIDQYGASHPKSLATGIKHLHSTPLPCLGHACLTPEWKTAIVDACLAALCMALKTPSLRFRSRQIWQPTLEAFLRDFAARTPLRHEPGFDAARRKLQDFMTHSFAYRAARGDTKYRLPDGTEAELIMLTPYLPRVCCELWGGALTQLLLHPLYESRFCAEMRSAGAYQVLRRSIPAAPGVLERKDTEIGRLTVLQCRGKVDGQPIRIIELEAAPHVTAPGAINHYIHNSGGLGFSIFHSAATATIVLGKGDQIPPALWEAVVTRLVALEGASDDPAACGAWHVTRSPAGLAPFLLNGNPTHRYVPRSAISAGMLVRLVDECLAGMA